MEEDIILFHIGYRYRAVASHRRQHLERLHRPVLPGFFRLAGHADFDFIEYREEIVQKLDPIFMDPEHKLIKAHFYSPVKRIFGQEMDTYWVNVIVLWFITVAIYFILYFRLLKKILDSGGTLMGRKHKSYE